MNSTGVTAGGPGSVADMLKPRRTRAEKAALKKQNLAHAEILLKDTPEYRERMQDPQSEKQADYLELGLILDATKSMKPWINRAKETLTEVIDSVVKESKEEGENPLIVRVCFIGFRDHKDDERFSICPFTENVQEIKDFMNNCVAEGGKDIPEDVVGGLKMCLMQDWTADSIKKVFMIGDAPCHGKQYTGELDDHYPEGSPEGLTVESLMKEYCKHDIEFSIIKLNNSVDKMIEAMRQHHQELDVKDMSSQTVEKALADYVVNMPASSSSTPGYSASLFGSASTGVTAGGYRGGGGGGGDLMMCDAMDAAEDEMAMESMAMDSMAMGSMAGAPAKKKNAMMSFGAPVSKSSAMEMAMDREYAHYAISKTKAAVSNYRAKKMKK